jgi:hypothetical protein
MTQNYQEGEIYYQQEATYPVYSTYEQTPTMLGVPRIEKSQALMCLIFNIFIPGVGTMIGSLLAPSGCDLCSFIYGFLQFCLASMLVGWVWSLIWGLLMYQSSFQHHYVL